MSDKAEQIPAIRIAFNSQIAEGNQVMCETYMERDVPREDLNKLMDKMAMSIMRQKLKQELPALKKLLDQHVTAYERGQQDIERIASNHQVRASLAVSAGRRREPEPLPKDVEDRKKAEISVARWKEEAMRIREMIAEHEATINEST